MPADGSAKGSGAGSEGPETERHGADWAEIRADMSRKSLEIVGFLLYIQDVADGKSGPDVNPVFFT